MNSHKGIKKELYHQDITEVICNECYGEGTYDVGPECFKPASECCGGCYTTRKCHVCRGKGNITIDEDNDEMNDEYMMYVSIKYRIHHLTLLVKAVELESPEFTGSELSLLKYDIQRLTVFLERITDTINAIALENATDDVSDIDEDYEY